MAQPTYSLRALVLRRTKLGESDLILTLLAEDGSQQRTVAKGARRPKSSFAARTEPFCVIDALCAKGRSLDILKEARLVAAHDALRCNRRGARTGHSPPKRHDKQSIQHNIRNKPRYHDNHGQHRAAAVF